MCRVLLYLGKELSIGDVIFNAEHSLVHQSYDPQLMFPHHAATNAVGNLAGFGLAAWDGNISGKNSHPFCYKTRELPFYDSNLKNIAESLGARCLLAHVRGVSYSHDEIVTDQNVHPFFYEGFDIAFAHNGYLPEIKVLKPGLRKEIATEFYEKIRGTTDSEWIYALFLTQLKKKQYQGQLTVLAEGVVDTLSIISSLLKKNKILAHTPLNFYLTNGRDFLATRLVLEYGRHAHKVDDCLEYPSLWCTYGDRYIAHNETFMMTPSETKYPQSVIFASEPLTEDRTTWIEVPEYSLITATRTPDGIKMNSYDLGL